MTSNEAPVTSNEAPVTSNEAPATSEEAPVTSKEAPMTSKEAPAQNNNNKAALPETGEQNGRFTSLAGLLVIATAVLVLTYTRKSQKD